MLRAIITYYQAGQETRHTLGSHERFGEVSDKATVLRVQVIRASVIISRQETWAEESNISAVGSLVVLLMGRDVHSELILGNERHCT